MYKIEPIQEVQKRIYLINALTSKNNYEKAMNFLMYKYIQIKPIADLAEQIAIIISKLKK